MLSQEFLKETTLFQDLTEEELLEVILIGHVKKFEAGKVLFREGDSGDTLYLIISGCVRISKMRGGTEEALTVLESKSFFGEMTLFNEGTRSAYAIAHEDSNIFVISAKDLTDLFKKNREVGFKFLWAFCNTLTDRLRETNEKFEVIMSLANDGF